jgi:hypothetical protein
MTNEEARKAWDDLLSQSGALDARTREQLASEIDAVAAACDETQADRREILKAAAARLRGPHPELKACIVHSEKEAMHWMAATRTTSNPP